MEQNPKEVARQYDAVAKVWAETFSDEHEKKPKDQEMLYRFFRHIGNRKPVWDLGCGPGNTTRYLSGIGVEISGHDLSDKMLEQARAISPGVHFQKGNILELEFEDDSIAGIVAFYAIVHFTAEQVRTAIREVHRVLKPGGVLLFTYHAGEGTTHIEEFFGTAVDLDLTFFDSGFINRLLKESGFEKIEICERDPYPGIEYESRRAYVLASKPEAE